MSLRSPEAVLNLLLFVPAAFFGVLALGRAIPIVIAAFVCSASVEAIQLITTLGTCQTADVVRNVMGAALASGAALLLRQAHKPVVTTSNSKHVRGQ